MRFIYQVEKSHESRDLRCLELKDAKCVVYGDTKEALSELEFGDSVNRRTVNGDRMQFSNVVRKNIPALRKSLFSKVDDFDYIGKQLDDRGKDKIEAYYTEIAALLSRLGYPPSSRPVLEWDYGDVDSDVKFYIDFEVDGARHIIKPDDFGFDWIHAAKNLRDYIQYKVLSYDSILDTPDFRERVANFQERIVGNVKIGKGFSPEVYENSHIKHFATKMAELVLSKGYSDMSVVSLDLERIYLASPMFYITINGEAYVINVEEYQSGDSVDKYFDTMINKISRVIPADKFLEPDYYEYFDRMKIIGAKMPDGLKNELCAAALSKLSFEYPKLLRHFQDIQVSAERIKTGGVKVTIKYDSKHSVTFTQPFEASSESHSDEQLSFEPDFWRAFSHFESDVLARQNAYKPKNTSP